MSQGEQSPRGGPRSHGSGLVDLSQFLRVGSGVIIEPGVLVFHPETIEVGDDVYVGHQTILKGYYRGHMRIGRGTWIGQQCFLHSAGNINVGADVGIGPGVKIITSFHGPVEADEPIMRGEIQFAEVTIGDGSDIGVGAILLPGVHLGKGVQVGAGAVVTRDVPDYAVVAGVPARPLRSRRGGPPITNGRRDG